MKKRIVSIRPFKPSFMRLPSVVAGILALTALTEVPNAFAAPADKPAQRENQTHTTSTLATLATINRNVNKGAKTPRVYKGNVYGIYVAQEGVAATETTQGTQRVMVYKMPLDGSSGAVCQPLVTGTDITINGYYAAYDNHKFFTLDVDGSGYIHVSGGMHTGPSPHTVFYWRSDRPGDISSFTRKMTDESQPSLTPQPAPIAHNVTGPHLISDRHGKLFWYCHQGAEMFPMCSYDEATQKWTSLGGICPKTARKGEKVISFAWEDNACYKDVGGKPGLAAARGDVVFDSKNRMHIVIGLKNQNTYDSIAKAPHFVMTDILYAYSDDGGKTVHKSDGTQIQLPIRAEAGPNQGEIVLKEDGDTVPTYQWLSQEISITVDKEDRPMIKAESYRTGKHFFRLESGKWVDYPNIALGDLSTDPSGVVIGMTETGDFTRFSNPSSSNTEIMDAKADGYDRAYYRDTGELVWTTLKGTPTEATLKVNRTVFKPSEREALRPSP